MVSNLYKHIGRKLTEDEVTKLYNDNPFWIIESPPLVVRSYKDGRREMFVNIKNIRYFIKQDRHGLDKWYEVKDNGSS